MKNHFAPYNTRNKHEYHDPPWKIAYDSIGEFLDDRVMHYLDMYRP